MEGFREFVERAQQLRSLEGERVNLPEDGLNRFRAFAEAASARLLSDLDASAGDLRAATRPSTRWIGKYDLLALGGLTLVENAYTRLLAWALDPRTHQPSAIVRQRAWLAHAGIDRPFASAAKPSLFLSTSAGVPDLVLRYENFVVVIEAKTITSEHTSPAGQLQSHAYGPAVAVALGRPPDSVETVYLTLERALPDNPAARPVSHLGSFLAIAVPLEGEDLPADVQAGFRSILTHFAANADRPPRDLRSTLLRLGTTDMSVPSVARLTPAQLKDLLTIRRLLGGTT